MKNLLIALVQASPNGPQVTQTGQIETAVGGPDANFIVRFDQPKMHRRIVPAVALQPYSMFENTQQFMDFITAVTPKKPVVPKEQSESPIDPPQAEVAEDTTEEL